MKSDRDLLLKFSETQDQTCFAEVVQRHIRFVYAVSLRRLRDVHAAQDATQAVFIALARKARSVAAVPSLAAWLHRSACYETQNQMRSQANRRARETEAQQLGSTSPEGRPCLEGLEAMIDGVLCELSEGDRQAILARYFSEHNYADIGRVLEVSENGARMRVDRALAKLRIRLERRGLTSTTAVLAAALPAYASAAVPSELAAAVTKASLVSVAGSTAAAAIIGFMSTAKVITVIAAAAALGGLFYESYRTSKLETELANARSENSLSSEQLQSLQRQIAELKPQRNAAPQVTPSALEYQNGARAAVAAASAPTLVPGVTPKPPKGWSKNGSANNLYEVGVDENNAWGGMPSAYASAIGNAEGKFGGMMQTISADAYKNQRVRLSGWAKTEEARDDGGHLWMRVDGAETEKMLQFDNMDGRAVKGTTDWQEYSVVLDVPPESTRLNYGFFVGGNGKMWVNGLTITPVTNDVPSTNMFKQRPALPTIPVNLGFAPPAKG